MSAISEGLMGMSREERDRIDRQLREAISLAKQIDALSARLVEAADAAIKAISSPHETTTTTTTTTTTRGPRDE